ncbi:Hypothetical protein PBC10988_22210 [Planctomycetales bacterium 10988]|nr:Hypothetical protein PBC10988_22210 [Planctomycetales bacterium 10988]
MAEEDKLNQLERQIAELEDRENTRFYISVLGIIVCLGLISGVWFTSNYYDGIAYRKMLDISGSTDAPAEEPGGEEAEAAETE